MLGILLDYQLIHNSVIIVFASSQRPLSLEFPICVSGKLLVHYVDKFL